MSKIKSIQIDEATPAQIEAFARAFLNLDVKQGASDTEILSAVNAAQPNATTIFVMDDDEQEGFQERIDPPLAGEVLAQGAKDVGRIAGSLGHEDPRALIRISPGNSEDARGSDDVAVGVNGRIWQLKRGVDINVPWRVVCALRDSVERVVRHDEQGDIIERDAERYPFSILQGPTQQEIVDWRARTDDAFCP